MTPSILQSNFFSSQMCFTIIADRIICSTRVLSKQQSVSKFKGEVCWMVMCIYWVLLLQITRTHRKYYRCTYCEKLSTFSQTTLVHILCKDHMTQQCHLEILIQSSHDGSIYRNNSCAYGITQPIASTDTEIHLQCISPR